MIPNFVFDGFFLVDMILSMFFMVTEMNQFGKWQKERGVIFKRYIKFFFFVDLLAFLPLYLVQPELLAVEFLRLRKITSALRLMQVVLKWIVHKLFKRASRFLTVYRTSHTMMIFCVWSITLTHLMSGLYIFISRIPEYDSLGKRIHSWLDEMDMDNGKTLIYLESLSFVMSTLTTLGVIRHENTTSFQMVLAIFFEFIGTLMVSYAISMTAFVHKKSESIVPLLRRVLPLNFSIH